MTDQEINQERERKIVNVLMNVTIAAEVSSIENKYHIYPFFLEKKEQVFRETPRKSLRYDYGQSR